MTITELIKEVQLEVGVDVDGNPGPATWQAIHARIINKSAFDQEEITGRLDPRSEASIATLHPKVRSYARSLVSRAAQHGIEIKVISGLRTYAEQDALFAKGGVTKARGGYSNHNFGIAFDVGVFSGGKYLGESPAYKAVGALGRDLGLEWGGDWKSFTDEPHFQLRPTWAKSLKESDMLAELRKRKANGTDAFA